MSQIRFLFRFQLLKTIVFKILGPSYTLQGGNGSLYHLIGHAKKQMEQGRIPAAVVVCANFIMTARALCNLDEMGFAAKDGKCRSFDEKGTTTYITSPPLYTKSL